MNNARRTRNRIMPIAAGLAAGIALHLTFGQSSDLLAQASSSTSSNSSAIDTSKSRSIPLGSQTLAPLEISDNYGSRIVRVGTSDQALTQPSKPTPKATPAPKLPSSKTPISLNATDSSYDCDAYRPNKPTPDDVPQDVYSAIKCAEAIVMANPKYAGKLNGEDITIGAVLRGISKVECNDGFGNAHDGDPAKKDLTCRDDGTQNEAKAVGIMQWTPCAYDNRNTPDKCWDKDSAAKSGLWKGKFNPAKEAGIPGSAVDGNGDGIADPYNVQDAVLASALKLANDYQGDWDDVLQDYNGGQRHNATTARYAENVLAVASGIQHQM